MASFLFIFIGQQCFLFLSVTIFSTIDLVGKVGVKMMLLTPDKEYINNNTASTNSVFFINDSLYLLIGKEVKPNIIIYNETQFVDHKLSQLFYKTIRNNILRERIKLDSKLCLLDKTAISERNFLQSLIGKEEINKRVIDSSKSILMSNLYKDLKQNDSLSKYAKFKSNRDYYRKQNLYLDDYCRSYFNSKKIKEILKTANKKTHFKLNDGVYVTLLSIDKSTYNDSKIPFLVARKNLEKRSNQANFIGNIIFFPLEKILDVFDFY